MAADEARTTRAQPESLRLSLITPAITVGDLGKSLTFYRDVLGFTVKEEWDGGTGAALVAGSTHFLLVQDDGAKGENRAKGAGVRFWLTTAQPVDSIAKAIEARGGTLESQPEAMPWGGRSFSIRDPDGFNITFASDD